MRDADLPLDDLEDFEDLEDDRSTDRRGECVGVRRDVDGPGTGLCELADGLGRRSSADAGERARGVASEAEWSTNVISWS